MIRYRTTEVIVRPVRWVSWHSQSQLCVFIVQFNQDVSQPDEINGCVHQLSQDHLRETTTGRDFEILEQHNNDDVEKKKSNIPINDIWLSDVVEANSDPTYRKETNKKKTRQRQLIHFNGISSQRAFASRSKVNLWISLFDVCKFGNLWTGGKLSRNDENVMCQCLMNVPLFAI